MRATPLMRVCFRYSYIAGINSSSNNDKKDTILCNVLYLRSCLEEDYVFRINIYSTAPSPIIYHSLVETYGFADRPCLFKQPRRMNRYGNQYDEIF